VEASHLEKYRRHNVMYIAKGVSCLRSSLEKFQTLNIVADEARCSNLQIMAAFLSAPTKADASFGFVSPLQVCPDISIDLDERSLDVRVETALQRGMEDRPAGKPKADPLVATWNVCLALDNSLLSTLGEGLMQFSPAVPMTPLPDMGPLKETRARYYQTNGRWVRELRTEEGVEQQRILPGFTGS
jgi:hypothetical protein